MPNEAIEDPDEDMGNIMNVMLDEPMDIDQGKDETKESQKMRYIKELEQIGEIVG